MTLKINPDLTPLEESRRPQTQKENPLNKMSTGLRIDSHSAQISNPGISESKQITAQILSYSQSLKRANDGISILQTVNKTLEEDQHILRKMQDLARQAKNEEPARRKIMQLEIDTLRDQIDDMAQSTVYDNDQLLSGTEQAVTVPSGINPGEVTKLHFPEITTESLGIDHSHVLDNEEAQDLVVSSETAIKNIEKFKQEYADSLNLLIEVASNLRTASHNISAARSHFSQTLSTKGAVQLAEFEIGQDPKLAVASLDTQKFSLSLLE